MGFKYYMIGESNVMTGCYYKNDVAYFGLTTTTGVDEMTGEEGNTGTGDESRSK